METLGQLIASTLSLVSIPGKMVSREPQRSTERIVFAIILITFSVFDSTLFAIITDIKITDDPDVVIDTLDDLNKSNLVPTMPELFYNIFEDESDHDTKDFSDKFRTDVSREECRKMLLYCKKVACIDRKSTSEVLGFTVLREPQRSAKRIVFTTLLIFSSVISSTIFAILTDIEIMEDPDAIIDTLDDLHKSNIVPMTPEIF